MGDDESQVINLLEHKTKCITTLDDKWVPEWVTLMEKYYKHETRNHIRLKTIALLSQIFSKYHVICEDELINKIILPNFSDADKETDSVVRKPIVHLLFDIASTCLSNKHCNTILAIIRKILTKPYKQKSEDEATGLVYIIGNIDIIDSRLIISNLNKLFKAKLFRLPIDPAVNMLDIVISYLNLTYRYPLHDPTPAEVPMIRRELFSLLLNLRCNKHGHLGVTESNQVLDEAKHSPFIICVKRHRSSSQDQGSMTPIPDSPTQTNFPPIPTLPNSATTLLSSISISSSSPSLSLATSLTAGHQTIHHYQNHRQQIYQRHQNNYSSPYHNIFVPNSTQPNCPIVSRCVNLDAMFVGIIDCISQETDLDVLRLVLDSLPGLLANKPILLTLNDDRINQLCLALCDLIKPNKVCNRQNSRIDIFKSSLKCLTTLLVYKKQLDQKVIKIMLSSIEDSLRNSRHPVVPLFTTCLIELQDSSEMTKFIPVILNRLSKFSPTPNLGISMLEFLSYLLLFPKSYENFSEDEYRFIFAIALPYTNPFRFSDYITCLAFRVIVMWYLNCRPSLRSAFVESVKKSLQSNVIQPFKENITPTYSQTSSPITQTPPITCSCLTTMSPVDQRKRSSSLNTENSFKAQQSAFGFPNPQSSLQVNEELIETFADLLLRYSHGQCLAITPKNNCAETLLDKSTSQTWLHGNSLVTITSDRSSQGWAEIMIRRPTGNTSWLGRLQNSMESLSAFNQQSPDSINLGNDIISLFSTMSPPVTEDANDNESIGPSSFNLSSTNQSNSNVNNTSSSPPIGIKLKDPLLLPKDNKFDIALSNFDHITPYETHKVGVVYVGRNQVDNRAAILSNRCGSTRYDEFLRNIGMCINLGEIDPEVYFIGGLDVKGDDGKYAYFWKNNVTQVIFHVATLMLARENDPQCNNKNRHIGNDYVCIVFNDSGQQFSLSTIKGTGQFIKACIIITPLEDDTNLIEAETLPDLRYILGDIEPKVFSNACASLYARQLAIHLNLASKIYERRPSEGSFSKEPYVSNWVERLRCIKRIRQRLEESRKNSSSNSSISRSGIALK